MSRQLTLLRIFMVRCILAAFTGLFLLIAEFLAGDAIGLPNQVYTPLGILILVSLGGIFQCEVVYQIAIDRGEVLTSRIGRGLHRACSGYLAWFPFLSLLLGFLFAIQDHFSHWGFKHLAAMIGAIVLCMMWRAIVKKLSFDHEVLLYRIEGVRA